MIVVRQVLAAALAATTLLAVLPIAPADAQWVMIGRCAIGRVHQMVQGPSDGKSGPGEDSTSSRVVSRVLQVCQEMQKQCSVKPKS